MRPMELPPRMSPRATPLLESSASLQGPGWWSHVGETEAGGMRHRGRSSAT